MKTLVLYERLLVRSRGVAAPGDAQRHVYSPFRLCKLAVRTCSTKIGAARGRGARTVNQKVFRVFDFAFEKQNRERLREELIRAAVSRSPVPAALLWRRDWLSRGAGPPIDHRRGVSLRCRLLLPAAPAHDTASITNTFTHTFYPLDNNL